MIQIKPSISINYTCHICGSRLSNKNVLWQGIHVCVETVCIKCANEYVIDLPIGHAFFEPYVINKKKWKTIGRVGPSYLWFGRTLEESLANPKKEKIIFKTERFKKFNDVVILNCIDYLYGHSLLKLLNTEKLLGRSKNLGVIVIIPKFLRWMVPKGVAEIWEVNIPLVNARNYYLDLNEKINKELVRFGKVYLSRAHSHPRELNISSFTGVPTHDFKKKFYRITFIWREDRTWFSSDIVSYLLKKFNFLFPLIVWQNVKVTRLLMKIKSRLPDAQITVAGLGKTTNFPSWVDDLRVKHFDSKAERKLCVVYSESRLIIGVHGSNMLLPSAHAGMMVNLVNSWRLSNIAEDVIYPSGHLDLREISYRYRYYPIEISISSLSQHGSSMVSDHNKSMKYFQS